MSSYNALIKDLGQLVLNKFKGKHQELRNICFGTSQVFTAMLLQQHAVLTMREKDIEIAHRWVQKGIYQAENYSIELDKQIAMDFNVMNQSRGVGNVDQRKMIRPKFWNFYSVHLLCLYWCRTKYIFFWKLNRLHSIESIIEIYLKK